MSVERWSLVVAAIVRCLLSSCLRPCVSACFCASLLACIKLFACTPRLAPTLLPHSSAIKIKRRDCLPACRLPHRSFRGNSLPFQSFPFIWPCHAVPQRQRRTQIGCRYTARAQNIPQPAVAPSPPSFCGTRVGSHMRSTIDPPISILWCAAWPGRSSACPPACPPAYDTILQSTYF